MQSDIWKFSSSYYHSDIKSGCDETTFLVWSCSICPIDGWPYIEPQNISLTVWTDLQTWEMKRCFQLNGALKVASLCLFECVKVCQCTRMSLGPYRPLFLQLLVTTIGVHSHAGLAGKQAGGWVVREVLSYIIPHSQRRYPPLFL